MRLGYLYRIYPTADQRAALARAFGCARTVYNDGLRLRSSAYVAGLPYIDDAELCRLVITQAKRTPERAWLCEVSAVVLQQALADLNSAYRNYFASRTGKRQGVKVGLPSFRSRKDGRQAIRFTRNARFAVTVAGRLRLPKVGDVRVCWSRSLPAEPSSVTVIKDAAGRYFASFVVESPGVPWPSSEGEIGIDLGLTHFAVTSDGRKIENPRFLRMAEGRLRRAQKALGRKEKGSRNQAKARLKVARAYARVADARRDWAHKLSTEIIRDNQAVYVENLCVSGLGRTHLAKSVYDAGWSQFTAMLEYKAARYGRCFVRIDRWFPSTKLCSVCGTVAEDMSLDTRTWTCPCGAVHDRDVNAARNILAAGRRLVAAGRKPASEMGGKRRLETPVEAGETPTPRLSAGTGARPMKQEATEVPPGTGGTGGITRPQPGEHVNLITACPDTLTRAVPAFRSSGGGAPQ